MRGEEYRARAKKTHKMTRDGLVEQNQATGEEARVSGRAADVSFEKARPQEQAAGHRAAGRIRSQNPQRKQQKPPITEPEPPVLEEEAPSMRDAGDRPIPRGQPRPSDRAKTRGQKAPATGAQTAKPDTAEGKPRLEDSRGRLRFEAEDAPPEERAKKPRQGKHCEDAAGVKESRLQFETDASADADTPLLEGDAPDAPKTEPRPGRKYEKAQRRVEKSGRKLEKAQARIPTRRRARLEKQVDSASGKVRRRLQFEQEPIPEYEKPSLPKKVGDMTGRAVTTAAVMKLHSKIREVERDNVAVEAAHKTEFAAERGAVRFSRWNRNRLRTKPYRRVRRAERRLAKDNANLAWQTALRDSPELQKKHALAKWVQKQKIKRKYAQAAREAQQTIRHTQNVLTATGQIIRAVAQYAAAHKAVFLAVALLAVVVLFFAAGTSSCTAMLSGIQSSYISASYMANEQEIEQSELYYTELETDLQIDIDKTEENYPGFDEYRYNIGEIGHNPYELMGYLSTAFNAFTFAQVQAELDRLFGMQYQLTREEIVETRYDSDGNPYNWYVLQTTLTVRPQGEIIEASLSPGEQTDRYGVYMQTYGNRQAYGNPFDFPWLSYVSSPYGYRIHPISGEKDLHRGMDIAVAQGTPILAIQDGRVASAGDAGDYGLCVVIEDDKGYQSRYAHCASLSVSAGQEVKRGDEIATVGSTGNSTGPHLHLEIKLDGAYLNPYYFVDNGDDGSGAIPGAPGGPAIPDYSGEPMGDGSFDAMLHEAEKFLGYPYVWGGSSPATSFDCSGFVSWVINQSGVGSVGRQTATGLYHLSTPVSRENARPGDLIFFTKTYSSPGPISHVGIYVGSGQMIHCGDPISYANINSSYWTEHFYGFARLN